MLKVVNDFNQSHVRSSTALIVLDWLTIDHDTFDTFRISYNPYDYHLSFGRPSNPSSSSRVIRKQPSDALREGSITLPYHEGSQTVGYTAY